MVTLTFPPLEQFEITQDGSIVLQSALDYETMPSYSLTISAVDSGFPSRSGTANLVINLLDANDNAPVFSGTQTTFSVLEVSVTNSDHKVLTFGYFRT